MSAVNSKALNRPPNPFRTRNFRLYWSGGLLSNIGTWLQNVTGSVYILDHTHSTLLVGLLNVATFAPIFLFSIVGGMIADRFDRRAVIIVTQLLSAAVATVITVAAATGRLNAPILIAMAFLLGTSYSISKPAFQAMLPAVVPRSDLAHATAMNSLQFNIGQLGGAILSASILAVANPTWAFGVNAASFVAPVVSTALLRVNDQVRTSALKGSGREGLRFALGSPAILAILGAVALSNASVECLRTLAPSLTSGSMHLDADSAGLLVMGYSAGGTAGIFAFGALSRRFSSNKLLVAAFLMQALGMVGLALSRNVVMGIAVTIPVGLAFAFNIPILSSGLLVLSPVALQGRVMSFFSMSMFGLRPLFSLTAGGLASVVSPTVVILIFVLFPIIALRFVGATSRAISVARSNGGAPAGATASATPVPNAGG
jgi:MFS family permease